MSYTQRRIDTRSNAEKLVAYLEQHQPATLGSAVCAGVMSSSDAANALQYGIRHRMIERTEMNGSHPGESAQYRLIGRPIRQERKASAAKPFEASLVA